MVSGLTAFTASATFYSSHPDSSLQSLPDVGICTARPTCRQGSKDSLVDSLAELCLARESGARNVDAFLNQRILPTVSRELLSRMANGEASAEIRLSGSPDGALTIDFVDRGDAFAAAVAPMSDAVPAGDGA
ncbi:hypothetical protein LMG27174_04210 [Paraburkholderia rhynchosiae]|uniref:Clp ATPase C-terminal domain-containing protein n=1 Tax=Paraburkholderia rhynchosiae TaxID=487049 RepID=A0A6J5BL59_9BURK|nr:hypothetical protein LMG27174_04210 [Paraburkholderia rhynchosiae]